VFPNLIGLVALSGMAAAYARKGPIARSSFSPLDRP